MRYTPFNQSLASDANATITHVPLRVYDSIFGGKPGAAAETHAAMVKQYGAKQGNSVFYATIEKKKKARKKIAKPTRVRPRPR